MAKEAWPAASAVGSKALELSGMEGYMEHSLGMANWTDVAYTSEGVIGFLFGRIDGYREEERPKRPLMGEVPTILRTFFEHDRMTPTLLRFIWGLLLTDLKLKLLMPRSDASIEMFIVDSEHRGEGVGSDLIGRFLKAAGDSGSALITLYTDDMTSNWRFYERRGFKRLGTFHDNLTSYYSGADARGIIYALDLGKGEPENGLTPR